MTLPDSPAIAGFSDLSPVSHEHEFAYRSSIEFSSYSS